jgi:MFS family permease
LGFAEAPFFPGAIFLMSSWYTRQELAYRIAWFYSGSSLASAFGGLLGAGVLGNMDGAHGISGWYVRPRKYTHPARIDFD